MPETARRKRFQIHLSTAVVMMFVSGGIIWANVSERLRRVDGDKGFQGDYFNKAEYGSPILGDGNWTGGKKYVRGWPCEAMQSLTLVEDYNLSARIWTRGRAARYWHASAVVVNACIALAILFTALFSCEWLIVVARKGA